MHVSQHGKRGFVPGDDYVIKPDLPPPTPADSAENRKRDIPD